MRNLQEYTRAVAGVGFTAGRATVVKVLQHLDRLLEDLVRLASLHVDDEADAAGVVFEPGIIQTLFFGHAGVLGPVLTGTVTTALVF